MVKQNRSIWKLVLFNLLTCGLYSYFFMDSMAHDADVVCAGDGETTPGFLQIFLFNLLTCGFYSFYWYYKLGNRLANKLGSNETGTTVLLWMFFGSFLCGIGYFIGANIVIRHMNALTEDYTF